MLLHSFYLSVREPRALSVYQALYLMIAFASLLISLMSLIVLIVRADRGKGERSRNNKNNRQRR